ncbi:TetR/AcrR family transcriptional regulator [Streptomyces sp. NBC_00006]|uniref:TetR/AcrR family transcriptional regulator n=1 Tax=unclassified Streptomyces TaxID=2593676 RepID=UPI00225B2FFE|nr:MULTISPECIES: TetR/AcrR family transcriptional regulator [unclassified Streptomyces]MCX5535496.1 TetR/AcrR family transcriptional regulator [Streptomyces sp. NBC_00006]
MARPRMFDEERALDAAMHAFWEHGYEATSTQDLCTATGLGRSSIYNTFASKHDLFTRSLTRYIERMTADQMEILEDAEKSPLDRIRTLFAMTVDTESGTRKDGHSRGCLTVNTTVEFAGRDPESARLVERDLDVRLAALRSVITAGQTDGSITSKRPPEELARFLNTVIGGMRVSGQGGADRATLEATAHIALDALTG